MHFQELKQNKCMKAQIVFFLSPIVNGYIFSIRNRNEHLCLLLGLYKKSHAPDCIHHHCEMHLVEEIFKGGGRWNVHTKTFFLPHTAHLLFLTWNRVGLSEGPGVCFCWFHSGGEGAQGGLQGWAAPPAAAPEPEVQGVSRRQPLSDVNALHNNLNRSVINICNRDAALND